MSVVALLGFHVEWDGLPSTDRPVTQLGMPSPGSLINRNQPKREGKSGRALPEQRRYPEGSGYKVLGSHTASDSPTIRPRLRAARQLPSAGFLGVRRGPAPPSAALTPAEVAVGVLALRLSGRGGHLACRGVNEGPSETAISPGGWEGWGLKGRWWTTQG